MIQGRSYEAEMAFRDGEDALVRHVIDDPLVTPDAKVQVFFSWLRKSSYRTRLVPTNPATGAWA